MVLLQIFIVSAQFVFCWIDFQIIYIRIRLFNVKKPQELNASYNATICISPSFDPSRKWGCSAPSRRANLGLFLIGRLLRRASRGAQQILAGRVTDVPARWRIALKQRKKSRPCPPLTSVTLGYIIDETTGGSLYWPIFQDSVSAG